jgi:hypothetical protein
LLSVNQLLSRRKYNGKPEKKKISAGNKEGCISNCRFTSISIGKWTAHFEK